MHLATEDELFRETRRNSSFIPLYIDDLLFEKSSNELQRIQMIISRYSPTLKQIFQYYSKIGAPSETINFKEVILPKQETISTQSSFDMKDTALSVRSSISSNSGRKSRRSRASTPKDNFTPDQSVEPQIIYKQSKIFITKPNEMSMLQFWKFAKDSNLIGLDKLSFAFIDRVFIHTRDNAQKHLAVEQLNPIISHTSSSQILQQSHSDKEEGISTSAHNPNNKIEYRDFVETLVRLASHLYKDLPSISERVQILLTTYIIPNFEKNTSTQQNENLLFIIQNEELEKVINEYKGSLWELFVKYSCAQQSENIDDHPSQINKKDITMTVEQFLRMLKV